MCFLPLAVFVWVTRYQGLFSQTIKSDAWQIAFYFGATSALIIIAIYFLFGFPINQIALSANLFLIMSAILFFINFEFLLYFLSDYSGSVFFLCVVLTSLLCISTQAKCISDPELSPSQNRRLCMFLLFGSVFAF